MRLSAETLSAKVPGSSPALMHWVQNQLAVGLQPATLQASLEKAGWSPSIAQQALAACLQTPPPAMTAMPEPNLAQHTSTIDVGDCRVQVLLSMHNPRLVLFGNVLSDAECEDIIAHARPAMARSRTVATQTSGQEITPNRTSSGMFYTRGQTPTVTKLEARIAKLLNWPVENGEGLQVLNYLPGAQYKPHHDYFNPQEPSSAAILQRGGQRLGTVVIYLNDVPAGGCTYFPETQLRIHPRKGHALFFSYPQPHADTRSLHGGDPVIEGEKWIATKWLREGEFR